MDRLSHICAMPPLPDDGGPPAAPDVSENAAERLPLVSTVALVAANAIPLAGALLLGWGVYPILLLYWLENVTSGAFNVLRMLVSRPSDPVNWVGKVFLIPFFCLHYGMFTAVHGVFVFSMFGNRRPGGGLLPSPDFVRGEILATGIEYAMVALVLSHAVSFLWNFLIGGEFRRVGAMQLMAQPYSRVIVLHLVIILGGAATVAIGSPVAAIAVLVLVKTTIDVAAHTRERRALAAVGGGLDPLRALRERLMAAEGRSGAPPVSFPGDSPD
jgi:hypothetical protein